MIARLLALLLLASGAYGADYTRDGGTADWQCCADKVCTTILSQHADPVRAYNACGKLTDVDGVTRYVRSNAFRITSTTAPVPPTCGPKPADLTQTAQCPSGTTGDWLQVKTHISASYPTCWTQSEWTPAEPPTDACTLIPPPVETITNLPVVCSAAVAEGTLVNACAWTQQAFRAASTDSLVRSCPSAPCTYTTARWQRFGALTAANVVEVCEAAKAAGDPVDSTGSCTRGVSTWDAMAYVPAAEVVRASGTPAPPVVEPPSESGTTTLSWTPPTQNTDGSKLTNLAGYYVHYGRSADALYLVLHVPNPALTSYVVTDLEPGTYYLAMRAYTSDGNESAQSNITSVTIP